MRTNEYRGRTYTASSTVAAQDAFQGVFDVDSTSEEVTDGVINEATAETFSTREDAEKAAALAAECWIDSAANKG